MGSIFGRAMILPLTNKSGGALAKGDVVIIDASNDNAVTTTTTSASTAPVGVVVEENGIANNASGRVQFGGYVALVTVNASVTRGHYAVTHTVAKQAAGSSSRLAGAFGMFTTGGTTPAALLFSITDASTGVGGIATTIVDAKGDLISASANDTPAILSVGSNGKVLQASSGASTGLAWVGPSIQYEVDYAQITSNASVTGTTEGSPTDVVTGASVAFDGSTVAILEFYAWVVNPSNTVNRTLTLAFYDGTTSLGPAAFFSTQVTGVSLNVPCFMQIRYTPSNASHTFKVAGWVSSGTGTVGAGAGGTGANRPAYLRVSKLTV